MARLPRIDVPGMPQHVVVRGVDRQPCFFDPSDYAAYLEDLRAAATIAAVAVHAFVLMTNHVHVLATGALPRSISVLMQSVGRRYVRRINQTYRRTGTLFEGRFRASVVQSERYLLTCMRYIELNPVRAAMVRHPADYRWSSFRRNAGFESFDWLQPHPEYVSLGQDSAARTTAYRGLFQTALDANVSSRSASTSTRIAFSAVSGFKRRSPRCWDDARMSRRSGARARPRFRARKLNLTPLFPRALFPRTPLFPRPVVSDPVFSRSGRQGVPVDKVLALAAALEDDEIVCKACASQVRIVDLNVLLYAVNSDAPHHERIREWWEAAMNNEDTVGCRGSCYWGFCV